MRTPFIIRQLSRSSKQAVVFILCVMLSISAITAFSGFSKSVNRSLQKDARKLHAADIIVSSGSQIPDELDEAIAGLVDSGAVVRARYYEFYSVVRSADDQASVLADIKIVEKGYPFYGKVLLKSGRQFHDVLKSGNTVVAQSLLDRLGLKTGDDLQVGYVSLKIIDVVTAEPDRPVELFSFGPRVFVNDTDRLALDLIQKGSRIRYVNLLKAVNPAANPAVNSAVNSMVNSTVDPLADASELDSIVKQLKKASGNERIRINTYQTARSRLKRFLDNLILFLELVGFFILIIAGFGIQGTLKAFLDEKKTTIAIMKTVGATNRYITLHFMQIVAILGFTGIGLGLLLGYLTQLGLAQALDSFLPANMVLTLSWTGVLEGVALGVVVVIMFSFIPLYGLKEMRPVMIFRKETSGIKKKWIYYASGLLSFFLFSGLVFWHMKDLRLGLYFIGDICGLIILSLLFSQLGLVFLKRLKIKRLIFRQAVKSVFRRGNATKLIVITLTASLSVIFSIFLVEKNLDETFIQSFPDDAPNMFFLDIQPAQLEEFKQTINMDFNYYPVIRARVSSIKGKPIDPEKEHNGRHSGGHDNFSRVFNLTYREHLLKNEKIIKGRSLFHPDWSEVQVSILDTVVEMRHMEVGDLIEFKIQGVPLEARISSVRTRESEAFSPFFYFVFQEKVLKDAPHTIFASLKTERDKAGPLQTKIAARFPNISAIDVSETIKTFSKLIKQLSMVVRFFTVLSIVAGILILISTILATRAERVIESVYYKILGAKKSFVLRVFALENILIGLVSGVLALIMSQITAYVICDIMLEIPYHPYLLICFLMIVLSVLLIVTIGMLASRSILNKKPVIFLREQQDA